jgi:hypothetical protein
MAFSKNLEEVWHWKEEVAQETENLTAEEQINYFHRASQEFIEKSIPPLELPVFENASAAETIRK